MPAIVTPTLTDLLNVAMDSRFESLFTALVCSVESYDNTKQEADLRPVSKVSVRNVMGELVEEKLPILANVPVAFPRAGDWFITMPVTIGDTMIAIVMSRSFEDWRATGEDLVSEDVRVNPLSAVIALPCNIYPKSEPLANSGSTNMTLGNDLGIRAYLRADGFMHLGEATDFVALAAKVLTELTSLQTQINALITVVNANAAIFTAHTHPGVTVGAGVTGTPAAGFGPATPITAPNSVAANKIKAE